MLLRVIHASFASSHGQQYPLPMWGVGRPILELTMHDVTAPSLVRILQRWVRNLSRCAELHDEVSFC